MRIQFLQHVPVEVQFAQLGEERQVRHRAQKIRLERERANGLAVPGEVGGQPPRQSGEVAVDELERTVLNLRTASARGTLPCGWPQGHTTARMHISASPGARHRRAWVLSSCAHIDRVTCIDLLVVALAPRWHRRRRRAAPARAWLGAPATSRASTPPLSLVVDCLPRWT